MRRRKVIMGVENRPLTPDNLRNNPLLRIMLDQIHSAPRRVRENLGRRGARLGLTALILAAGVFGPDLPFVRAAGVGTSTTVATNAEATTSPEVTTTLNYRVSEFSEMKGNRMVMIATLDGSSEKRLIIVDIDFLSKESLGRDMGPLPINVTSVDVNGDNIVAGGTQLSDPTKGALWFSQHGGNTARVFSSETGQIQGPIQRVQIPDSYDSNDRNRVFITQKIGEEDIGNNRSIPILSESVLDMNTGAVTPLSGAVATYSEGQILPTGPTTYESAGINREYLATQAGYTVFKRDLGTGTTTTRTNTEGTNNAWLQPNIIRYFRGLYENRKLITLTFNDVPRPAGAGEGGETGTMNYNIEDKLAYSIIVNVDDPVYKGGGVVRPSAAAEGKKLLVAAWQQTTYNSVTGNFRHQSFLVEIDPAKGYDNIAQQKVIGSPANELPIGDGDNGEYFNGVTRAVYIVKDGEGGDIPVLVDNEGIRMQNAEGNFFKIPIEKKPKYKIFLPINMVRG